MRMNEKTINHSDDRFKGDTNVTAMNEAGYIRAARPLSRSGGTDQVKVSAANRFRSPILSTDQFLLFLRLARRLGTPCLMVSSRARKSIKRDHHQFSWNTRPAVRATTGTSVEELHRRKQDYKH